MRILFLSLYPIDDPKHGGQLRSQGLIAAYQRAGHDVALAGVLGSEGYAETDGFVSYPGDQRLSSSALGGRGNEDYGIAKLFAEDPDFFSALSKKIRVKPDVIHVEQPWLFDFARKYVQTLADGHDIKLIYGSQNIEYLLKKDILQSAAHPDWERLTQAVLELETRAMEQADGVLCVSRHDEEWVRNHTATPVQFAPNGISPWVSSDEAVSAANNVSQQKQFALFCGSAHQPNVNGFASLLGGGFGALDFDQRLVVAGAAGYLISQHEVLRKSPGLADRLITAGMVSSECLSGLLETAHCIILPLTLGGGTNLKTAEALWSGRHVVATSVAMRGFEAFIGAPGVVVEDTPEGFKKAIRTAMQAAPLMLTEQEQSARRVVLWDACLHALPSFVETIVARAS
jgi:glycosyltransferase involved in cell wall biosynthesis